MTHYRESTGVGGKTVQTGQSIDEPIKNGGGGGSDSDINIDFIRTESSEPVEVDTEVTILVDAVNEGTEQGSATFTVFADGTSIGGVSYTLDPGIRGTDSVTFTPTTTGSILIEVGNASEDIAVEDTSNGSNGDGSNGDGSNGDGSNGDNGGSTEPRYAIATFEDNVTVGLGQTTTVDVLMGIKSGFSPITGTWEFQVTPKGITSWQTVDTAQGDGVGGEDFNFNVSGSSQAEAQDSGDSLGIGDYNMSVLDPEGFRYGGNQSLTVFDPNDPGDGGDGGNGDNGGDGGNGGDGDNGGVDEGDFGGIPAFIQNNPGLTLAGVVAAGVAISRLGDKEGQ